MSGSEDRRPDFVEIQLQVDPADSPVDVDADGQTKQVKTLHVLQQCREHKELLCTVALRRKQVGSFWETKPA